MDDESKSLEQAEIFLNKEDKSLNVDTAGSGEKALEILEEMEYDAIVADYKMSRMNGIDLLREFRKIDEKTPFIILTGKGNEKVAKKALNLGATRYLWKKDSSKAQYEELAKILHHDVKLHHAKQREKFLDSLLRLDIRNKNQIICEYLDLLSETNLNSEQKNYLEKARKAAESELELVDKIKKIKRVKEEETREVNLDSIIEDAIELNEGKETKKGVEIFYEKSECTVLAGYLLEVVFSQLLDNSIRHSNCDKIKITPHPSDKECIVTVEDDGEGIHDEIEDDLFEKGWSGKGKRGSGLGLYMVKTIVERYEGKVECKESELGGARFDIHLKKAKK